MRKETGIVMKRRGNGSIREQRVVPVASSNTRKSGMTVEEARIFVERCRELNNK